MIIGELVVVDIDDSFSSPTDAEANRYVMLRPSFSRWIGSDGLPPTDPCLFLLSSFVYILLGDASHSGREHPDSLAREEG